MAEVYPQQQNGVQVTPRQKRRRAQGRKTAARRQQAYVRQGQLRDKPGRGEADLEVGIAALGLPYERQARIGPYFADFLIKPYRLVVEVDGREHAQPGNVEHDVRRDAWMTQQGYRVVRVSSDYARWTPHNAALTALDALTWEELGTYKALREADFYKIREYGVETGQTCPSYVLNPEPNSTKERV